MLFVVGVVFVHKVFAAVLCVVWCVVIPGIACSAVPGMLCVCRCVVFVFALLS